MLGQGGLRPEPAAGDPRPPRPGPQAAACLTQLIAAYGRNGPSLILSGVGVLPLEDTEDRHVLETAFAGGAELLATQNLADFEGSDVETLTPERARLARHGDRNLLILHLSPATVSLRGDPLPAEVARQLPGPSADGPA